MVRAAVVMVSVGLLLWSPVAAAAKPAATSQSVNVQEDRSIAITLSGTDLDGDALTYTVETSGTRGTVTCSGTSCTYTPPSNFSGVDLFYFRVSDATSTSPRASVTVTVNPVNDAPVASGRTGLSVQEDQSRTWTLSASDVDADPLTFEISTQPAHGTVVLSGSSATYTPTANYAGSDSFRFRVSDGTTRSAPAIMALTVSAVNDAPSLSDYEATFDEDTSHTFSLPVSDVDGDTLTPTFPSASLSGGTYTTGTGSGTFVVSGTQVTYTPSPNFHGDDTFVYSVSDGRLNGPASATVYLHVDSVNDAPTTQPGWTRAANGQPAHLVLTGSDIDGDTLSFTISTAPSSGSAVIWNGDKLAYTPSDPGVQSTDTLWFTATDGIDTSSPLPISIEVVPEIARFPLDELQVDSSVTQTRTSDGNVVLTLPSAPDDCQKTQATQPVFEASVGGSAVGMAGVVAAHYNGLRCGYDDYDPVYSSIYIIANNGVPDQFEARLLDTGRNIEAPGVALDDGTLLFAKAGGTETGGGLFTYTPGSVSEYSVVTHTLDTVFNSVVDSSPLYDPASGVTLLLSAASPICGDAADNDCGAIVALDGGGNELDILDEDDGHHAWGSSGCIRMGGGRYCGFGPGSNAAGPDWNDDNACAVLRIDGIPTPPRRSNTVDTELSIVASHDPGGSGCTEVEDLESSFVNGGLASDGTYLYALAYGSDDTDAYTRVYQYDEDLNPLQTFEIPADYTHAFTNGFQVSMVISGEGKVYVTGTVDDGGSAHSAVVELDPATGEVWYLAMEAVTSGTVFGNGHLYVTPAGDEVIAYAVGSTGVVTRLSDGAEIASYELGETTGNYVAAPVLIHDGVGDADALMFVATDNVVTIVPGTGLAEDTAAPWPGPRAGGRLQATPK